MNKRIGVIMYQTSMSKGQELVAQRMVRAFRRLGHEAYLITSIYHDGAEVIPLESLAEDKGYAYAVDSETEIPVIRVNSFISKWPPRRILFKDFIHTLERIVNDFGLNVLITHSTLWNGPEEVVKFVEWRHNLRNLGGYQDPTIFCHMSHFQEPSPKRYSLIERSFRIAWNRLSLPQIFRVASLLLVVTPYEEDAKVRMGAKREQCHLFPGGVDDEAFLRFAALTSEEFLKRFNLKKDVKVVAYLGTIEERKNPKAVVQVAQKLQHRQDIHFVIAGSGNSKYANEVREAAQGLRNMTYLGELDEREKMLLIKVSYLNMILSKLEALGLTQLEFMFQGVPVITSAVGGQSWLIRHDREGLHAKGPDDVEGAAAAVTKLVDDPLAWERLAGVAKKRASPFTCSRLIKDLDQALTTELERESGLRQIPADVRSTLLEPERVIRSWSSGRRRVVATDRRLFIQHGWLSRRVLEFPYGNITSIEHVRRYSWKTLLAGAFLTVFLAFEPYLRPIFSRTLMERVNSLLRPLLPSISLQFELPTTLLDVIPLIPLAAALVLFILQARTGFTLHGVGLGSVHLPRAFKQAVAYIRSIQDQAVAGARIDTKKELER